MLTGGTTTVAINSTLETGQLTVEGGTLKDDSGITAGPGGSLTTTLTGGTLTGQGNIAGPVTNVGGTVLPGDAAPGTFTISGNYTQQAGGTLAIGIDGSHSALLQVSGTATLGGDLQLTDLNGFTPSAGEEWVLIPSKPTQTGTFTLTGPSADLYSVTYSSDAVDLFPLASAPPPSPPANVTPPAISGTPSPGQTLSCSQGSWTNNPSAYAYRWKRSPSALLSGATAPTYAVQIADEGSVLTCTVTASNAAGAGRPAASAPIVVAEPGTLQCARPTGKLARLSLGPLTLGLTRAQARGILHHFAVTANNFDNFCLYGGWGIRVGYATGRVLTPVSKTVRSRVSGRIVLALTANPFYALRGVRPGMALAAAAKTLKLGRPFHIGSNLWYVTAGTPARGLLKVRGGIIQEVGLANEQLTSGTPASQRRFLSSFTSSPL